MNADTTDFLIRRFNGAEHEVQWSSLQILKAYRRNYRRIFAVYNALGYGFLEKVYAKALKLELERRGLKVNQEFPIIVRYLEQVVGKYYADLIVNDLIIVEIKATKILLQEHEAQLLNYLKAIPYEIGLLLNFGPKPEQKRRSFDNKRKEWWSAQNRS